jgi:hypothetical protein
MGVVIVVNNKIKRNKIKYENEVRVYLKNRAYN